MVETMGAFTSTLDAIGMPNLDPRIGDFEIDAVDEVLGLGRVFTELDSDLDAAVPLTGDTFRMTATPENRVQYALYRLRQERDARTKGDEHHV